MVAQFPLTDLQKALVEGLELIPQDWALTPLRGNKAPYRTAWQHEAPLTRTQIIAEIEAGLAQGYGIRTGTISGGIVAIDFDGKSAIQKALELSKSEPSPDTVTFTSDRPGREQRLYLIPQEYWEGVKTTKIKTGVIGDDGKPEQLELRWDGCQSVLPPSVHPTTGNYRWRRSPTEVAVAPAPMWVIEAMLVKPEPQQSERYPTAYTRKARTGEEWTNEEWALSYLSALSPYRADDYDHWVSVGMALHSVSDSLLADWDNWSRRSTKYTPGCCEKKWKSFKHQGVAIGTLAHMAKQDGWRSPFEKVSGRGGDGGNGGSNATCQKPSIREVIAKAEQILKAQFNSQLDSIEANILLEELRREAGVNEYNWEQKYLKPLREKLERSLALPIGANQPTVQTDPSEQLRLELLALIGEADPIKKVRKRAEIASHYGISKGEIEFLCRTLDGDTKTPKAQFFALDDFLNMESDSIDYLIPGLLPRGETVLCTGLPKSGKTLLAIDAGFAIATGESKFLGEAVQQGRVLLISVDESAQSTKAKLLKRGFRPRDAANIAVMTAWDISQLDVLEAKLEDFRPDLVIIDSLKRITAGREISENSAEFADVLYALKELIGRYGAASILIHHSNKNQDATGVSRVRGSTAIVGAVWGIWQMDIPESEDESDGKPSKGKSKPKRFDPTNPNRIFTAICRDTEGALLNIRFNPENHSYGISESDESAQSDRKTQEQIILQILAQVAPKGLTGREIMGYSDLGRGVYSVLNRMIDKRLITQRQSTTDARMTVYCLPKSKTPPPPLQSHPICDQYSSKSNTGKDLEIDHKLITFHKEIDHNLESDHTYVSNSNSQPVKPLVEIDHKNTNKGGEGVSPNPIAKLNGELITYKQCSDISDPWEEEYTLVNVDDDGCGEIVRVSPQQLTDSSNTAEPADATPSSFSLPQKPSIEEADSTVVEDAIASPTQPIWVWNKKTGECLGQVLCDGGNRLKIRRTGEPASRAKWHERSKITFENPTVNPTVSALSLNTSPTTPVQWEDSEQFLEEFED
jgi:hypothetical protein